MAKGAGRSFVLEKNGAVIGGGVALNMTVNGEGIDVTDKDSNGRIQYLPNTMVNRQLVFTVEGFEEDAVLRDVALGAQNLSFLNDLEFIFHDGHSITGDFLMTGYTENGPLNEAVTYTATFSSDGAWLLAEPA